MIRKSTAAGLAAAFALGALLSPLADARGKEGPAGDPSAGVRAMFSPGGEIEPILLEVVKNARKEIVVAMFIFTSRPLSEALGRAKARGVDVRVVLDKDQSKIRHGKLSDLRRSKIPLRLIELGRTGDGQDIRFHHKFMVVDREVVSTGSFNWTSQADESNWENEVVIASRKIAADFRETFEKAWQAAEEPPGAGD